MARIASRSGALCAFMILVALGCGRDGPYPLPLVGFKVEFGEQNIPTQMASDKTVSADITIKNASERTWSSKPNEQGQYAVHLSYHWLDHRGQVVVYDGLRTPLPRDLKPGESVKLNASIRAPQHPGRYTLEVTLVQEAVAWFPENDGGQLTVPVNVVEQAAKGSDTPEVQTDKNLKTDKTRQSLPDQKSAEVWRGNNDASSRPASHAEEPKGKCDQGSNCWAVQVGSYSQKKDAESRAKKLRDKSYDAYVVVANVKGRHWYQLRIGHLASQAEAVKLQDTLKVKEHLKQSFVHSAGK